VWLGAPSGARYVVNGYGGEQKKNTKTEKADRREIGVWSGGFKRVLSAAFVRERKNVFRRVPAGPGVNGVSCLANSVRAPTWIPSCVIRSAERFPRRKLVAGG